MFKIYGWLVYNGSLQSEKFLEINKIYKETAEKKGICLDLIKNNEIYCLIENGICSVKINILKSNPDFILFLDKDVRLAKQLEKLGYRLFNSAKTIELCDDKILTYQVLSDNGIKLPKTLFSPLMFYEIDDNDFIDFIEKEFEYPIVIKEAFGSFGQQVYLAENKEQLISLRKKLYLKPHLYQEFIHTSRGKDVRLHVVGDKVVASMLRVSENDFRANISSGAKMYKYQPPDSFVEVAIKASRLVGADFSGVDILFGENDQPIVCEINSNAHIKNIYECTGINVSEYIFDYILQELEYYERDITI
ncbi:ATP-grasp domain-containing protein [Caldicellulosiruptor acetigenus]|uniref:Alpha-L-glutamate ligase, RimK family n=1 Tax=Caldicellulosiruptor acetigenus 6A TaxID=632516 RepID=G2PUC1_9FIRM|nr:RimK family alpha-L-glutamate ligase [Caldicellulosiruptor acetigenus]AEM73513.1 alpha-L-glutamate ligase, RimK family [Caldicellulosiruptor acetigenus 6A]